MTIKELSQTHLTLVHVLHTIPRRASVGGPHTILMYTLEVSNSTTIEATKFAGPHKSCMHQYKIELAH
jgi:hypothetical protein